MYKARQTHSGNSFVHLLFAQLNAVKFACNWKLKGQQPGGKVYKTNFSRSIYQARTGHAPPNRNDSRDAKAHFRAFQTCQKKIIMSRNYLLDLYDKVHIYVHFAAWD